MPVGLRFMTFRTVGLNSGDFASIESDVRFSRDVGGTLASTLSIRSVPCLFQKIELLHSPDRHPAVDEYGIPLTNITAAGLYDILQDFPDEMRGVVGLDFPSSAKGFVGGLSWSTLVILYYD